MDTQAASLNNTLVPQSRIPEMLENLYNACKDLNKH